MIQHYQLRGRIKDSFRMVKTGCKVDNLCVQDLDYLHRIITSYMVSACRITLLMLLRTETADLDPEAFFTESELQMMDVYARNLILPPIKISREPSSWWLSWVGI